LTRSVGDLLDVIASRLEIDEEFQGVEKLADDGVTWVPVTVKERLYFHYHSWGDKNRNVRKVYRNAKKLGDNMIRAELGGQRRRLTLEDVELYSEKKSGDRVEKDCSCDGGFMLRVMERIGHAIRKAYHWIPESEVVDLILDNAGGHGSKDKIAAYRELLLDRYGVRLLHQVPRSMEMNILDLGVWMSLQSWVERSHRGCRSNEDALWFSCRQAWETFESNVFAKVHGRWKKGLKIMIADNGENRLIDDQ